MGGKILLAVTAAALCTGAAWFFSWYAVFIIPLLAAVFLPHALRVKIDPEEIEKIKTLPSEDKDPSRIWLNGGWELRYPGGQPVEIKLPADLAAVKGMAALKGPFRFTRQVRELPGPAGKKLFLCGRCIGGKAVFYINGNKCGESPGYVPFEIDITKAAAGIVFELRIDVHPGRRPHAPGNLDGLAPPYGIGIFRELYIEARDEIYIRRAFFEVPGGIQYVTVELEGGSEFPAAVAVSIKDSAGETVFRSEKIAPEFDEYAFVPFRIGLEELERWTPQNPVLYRIEVAVISGGVRLNREFISGVKTVATGGGEILINGGKTDLRGAVRCEHYPPYGASVPNWGARKDAAAMKETGLDLVYCQDYPPHPDFFAACDRVGIHLVFEFPFRRVMEESGREEAERMLESCMADAVAHPCFLFCVLPGGLNESALSAGAYGNRIAYRRRVGEVAGGFGVVKLNIDMYSFGHFARQLHRYGECAAGGLLVLNYIDTEAGRESRNKRELRKTDADLETLKLADKKEIGSLALGQFFTWGIMSGLNSINRKKKASADAVRAYIKTRNAGEITWADLPLHLPLRAVAPVFMAALAVMMIVPAWRGFFITAPPLYLCFTRMWFAGTVQCLALLVTAVSLAVYFNWNRRAMTGAAAWLGYPVFMRFYTSYSLRLFAILAAGAWLTAAGAVAAAVISGVAVPEVAAPVMAAAFFECLAGVLLAVPVRPSIVFAAIAVMEGAFVSWFFPAAAAAVFIVVKFFPWIVLFTWLDRKNIFGSRS